VSKVRDKVLKGLIAPNKDFYDRRRHETYTDIDAVMQPTDHAYYEHLVAFISKHGLKDRKCLEIGSASGLFQDIVDDYYGTDIADSLAKFYHKPYRVAESGRYPFDDAQFDAIWTITVYEHIPELDDSLLEIKRLLKPGGVVFFSPSWQCRPWAAEGYAVRSYNDFGLKGKLIKASVIVRDSVFWRSLFIFPKRILNLTRFIFGHRFRHIQYKKLTPNWDIYWTSDSDACNHIDPHDAILWFQSNGFKCLTYPTRLSALFIRHGGIVFQKL
jgi:SAM-dependent methyltransferase